LGAGEADQSGAEDECRKKRRDGFAVPRHDLPLRFQCQKPSGDPERLVMLGSLAHNAGKRN
jgi:hypothetical protein